MKRTKPSIGDIIGNPHVAKDFLAANPDLMEKIQAPRRNAAGPSASFSGKNGPIQPKTPKRPKLSHAETVMSAYLGVQKRDGKITSFEREAIKLQVGTDRCYYTPDFLVRVPGKKPLLIECKGDHKWEDGIIKWKSAKLIYGDIFDFEMWEIIGANFREVYP